MWTCLVAPLRTNRLLRQQLRNAKTVTAIPLCRACGTENFSKSEKIKPVCCAQTVWSTLRKLRVVQRKKRRFSTVNDDALRSFRSRPALSMKLLANIGPWQTLEWHDENAKLQQDSCLTSSTDTKFRLLACFHISDLKHMVYIKSNWVGIHFIQYRRSGKHLCRARGFDGLQVADDTAHSKSWQAWL